MHSLNKGRPNKRHFVFTISTMHAQISESKAFHTFFNKYYPFLYNGMLNVDLKTYPNIYSETRHKLFHRFFKVFPIQIFIGAIMVCGTSALYIYHQRQTSHYVSTEELISSFHLICHIVITIMSCMLAIMYLITLDSIDEIAFAYNNCISFIEVLLKGIYLFVSLGQKILYLC